MRHVAAFMLMCCALASAQMGSTSNGKNYAVNTGNGRSYAIATLASATHESGGANPTYTYNLTVAATPNPVLVIETATLDTGSVTLLSISAGTYGYCFLGSPVAGSGSAKDARNNYCILTATGTVPVTVTYNGSPSSNTHAVAFVMSGLNPWAPTTGYTTATSGTISLSPSAGDLDLSTQLNTNNNPTLPTTSNNCTNSTDLSAYGSYGYGATHCPNTKATANYVANDFSWNNYSGNYIGTGVVAKHQ